ncbi:hypothetical protein V8E36_004647 [Tilletia maclaganii]
MSLQRARPLLLVPIQTLDLRRLIRLLSSPAALPGSYHVRNRLLHAFLIDPDDFPPGPRSAVERPWDRVLKHGYAGWAVGAVPKSLLLLPTGDQARAVETSTAPPAPESTADNVEPGASWGIFFLSPGTVPDDDPEKRTPRLDLWLSTSSATDEESFGILSDVVERIVPNLILRESYKERAALGLSSPSASEPRRRVRFMCCSFDEDEAETVRRLQARRAQVHPESFLIRSDDPCIRFASPTLPDPRTTGVSSSHLVAPVIADDGGWKLDTIKEADIPDVVSTNKIAFPEQYVRQHIHISSLLRRRRRRSQTRSGGASEAGDQYEAVGWTYFHSNLHVASLYVRPEYRTFKIPLQQSQSEADAGEPAQSIGIGTLVTLDLTHKLVQAQRAALAALDLEDILEPSSEFAEGYARNPRHSIALGPCDVLAESEIGNVGAHAFMERGPKFRRAGVTSWIRVDLEVKPEAEDPSAWQ